MSDKKNPRLERCDPQSESCFQALVSRVDEELTARIALGEDPRNSKERRIIAELIADAILDSFVIRKRADARYQWKQD